jgi:hypothetical protein
MVDGPLTICGQSEIAATNAVYRFGSPVCQFVTMVNLRSQEIGIRFCRRLFFVDCGKRRAVIDRGYRQSAISRFEIGSAFSLA